MIRALARISVGNPVAVNLATLAVCAGGWMAYRGMPREVFPEFSLGSCLLYTSPSPRDLSTSRMPSSA